MKVRDGIHCHMIVPDREERCCLCLHDEHEGVIQFFVSNLEIWRCKSKTDELKVQASNSATFSPQMSMQSPIHLTRPYLDMWICRYADMWIF
jgi:hypothetical protein